MTSVAAGARNGLRKGRKLLRLLRRGDYRRGLFAGTAAAVEHEAVLRSIDYASALDIGANVGQFSLVLRAAKPDCVIHAFEPLAVPARTFQRVFAGDPKVILHILAAGDTPGQAKIHLSRQIASSSLLPITSRQSTIFPGTSEVGQATVTVCRADDVIDTLSLPPPLLIKLDVQGFELQALRGMPNLLESAAHVYAEVSFVEFYEGQALAPDIIDWLAEQGFRLVDLYNPSFSEGRVIAQADALFSRLPTTSVPHASPDAQGVQP